MRATATTKERLLTAARTCLLGRGYAATTVRDLIAESGTNQASINYHYGSKEALLNQALFDLNGEWGEMLFGVVAEQESLSPQQRWQRVIDSVQGNRELWFINFEAIVLAQHDETIRRGLAERGDAARAVLARAFGGVGENAATADVHAVGSRYYALLIGVAMQWLIDPGSAPAAADLAAA